jgi:hypothetical protein
MLLTYLVWWQNIFSDIWICFIVFKLNYLGSFSRIYKDKFTELMENWVWNYDKQFLYPTLKSTCSMLYPPPHFYCSSSSHLFLASGLHSQIHFSADVTLKMSCFLYDSTENFPTCTCTLSNFSCTFSLLMLHHWKLATASLVAIFPILWSHLVVRGHNDHTLLLNNSFEFCAWPQRHLQSSSVAQRSLKTGVISMIVSAMGCWCL